MVLNTLKTWFEARDECEQLGGSLIEIHDENSQETTDLFLQIKGYGSSGYWTGLHQSEWIWTSGGS